MLLGNCLKYDMLKSVILMIIFMVTVLTLMPANAQEKSILLREDFNNLENWRALYFPKIKEHTKYYIEKEETGSYLKAESNSSASGIIYKSEFNVVQYSKVRWRWKINNIFAKGNAKKKSGDDYPLRVYIIFKYNPGKASFGQKLKYGFAKAVYGEYPPHSSLNYIWANRQHEQNIIANPYAKEAQMIILQTGKENTGKWIEQEIDIKEDYRRAFGAGPPSTFSLAIMNDSDNTKESAVSYIDYIEVYR